MASGLEMQAARRKAVEKAHFEKFGVYPVVTGRTVFEGPEYLSEQIQQAIDTGEPYVEAPIPKGVVI